MNKIDVGSTVIWLDSSYTVVDVTKKGLVLKQNFSVGVTLNGFIPVNEVSLKKDWQKSYSYYIYYRNLGTKWFTEWEPLIKITKT